MYNKYLANYKLRFMVNNFSITSNYQPAGDQPKAINALIKGLESGMRSQMLLGITGSGKTLLRKQVDHH